MEMMTKEQKALIYLVRRGIGRDAELQFPFDGVDWKSVLTLSRKHGVVAIAMDGLQKVFMDGDSFPKPSLGRARYEWYVHGLSIEKDYHAYVNVLEHLAEFYSDQGIPVMLLKGFGLSLNYPVPSHRPSGDIDIYQWGGWIKADSIISEKLGISIDNSHHHHSVFRFEGRMVENHYDFINVHSHSSNKAIEATFKHLAEDKENAAEYTFPNGAKLFFPSPDLNALFVLRHCASHFAAEIMTLRQLLDWAFYADKHHNEVDWTFFWKEIKKMGMTSFVLCADFIAVEQLGFEKEVFHIPAEYADFSVKENRLVQRVLSDLLQPEFDEANGRGVLMYVQGRFRRWWHNRWKHRIVYSDSIASTFFAQIWSHLLKPSSLKG